MIKKLKQSLSLSLFLSLFLLLVLACGDEFDGIESDSTQVPASEEPTTEEPATDEPTTEEPASEPPPQHDNLENTHSIDDTCILWKPISEGDHNLVVLLPTNYGSPEVFVLDKNGNKVEQGRYVGRTNGDRATYRFSQPGFKYSNPSYLQVGGTKYRVDRPGLRHSC